MSQLRSYAMALAIVSVCAGSAIAANVDGEPDTIPLKEIWAFDIPGTRNIRELEPKPERGLSADELIRRSFVEQIRWSLNPNFLPKEGETAGEAFVVAGIGVDALDKAHGVLVNKIKRVDSVARDEELSLVFYVYNSGRSVRLDEVQRHGNTVTVKYHLHTT
jgi:hypothetical protein